MSTCPLATQLEKKPTNDTEDDKCDRDYAKCPPFQDTDHGRARAQVYPSKPCVPPESQAAPPMNIIHSPFSSAIFFSLLGSIFGAKCSITVCVGGGVVCVLHMCESVCEEREREKWRV